MPKGRLQTVGTRVQSVDDRVKPISRYGRGGTRYAPGRLKRRERVIQRDKFHCQNCEEHGRMTPLAMHSADRNAVAYVDHFVPLAQGGADTENNQWTLCKPCHDAKTAQDSKGMIREPRDFGECGDPVIA